MKRISVILIIVCFASVNLVKAQSFIISVKGGYAFILDEGFVMGVSVENKFNKYLSLGLNARLGGATYTKDYNIYNENNVPLEENELEISNYSYSVGIFPRFSFINTDELIISFVPEISLFWTESIPVLHIIDKINHEASYKDYDNTHSGRNIGYSLNIEGQYYIGERANVILNIGWNNYDMNKSMDKVNVLDWENEIDYKINSLYIEIGIAYRLFGKDIWY